MTRAPLILLSEANDRSKPELPIPHIILIGITDHKPILCDIQMPRNHSPDSGVVFRNADRRRSSPNNIAFIQYEPQSWGRRRPPSAIESLSLFSSSLFLSSHRHKTTIVAPPHNKTTLLDLHLNPGRLVTRTHTTTPPSSALYL